MKTHKNLMAQILAPDNLLAAWRTARKGKTRTRAVMAFDVRAGALLNQLSQQICHGTYRPRVYRRFYVYEPKPREICAPWFGDVVVQHAIYRIVMPLFEARFIDQSYACRPGKGTHAAADYAQRALRQSAPDSYTLKLDLRRFFYRIDRAKLEALIRRVIGDDTLVRLMMQFAHLPEPLGIPIGNLLSQLYALIYLNPLDHFVKRTLRVSMYCRYVDDFVLFDVSRQQAMAHKQAIEVFVAQELGMTFSKWTIAKTKRGINFVGYRTWRTRRYIRKHSLIKFNRALRREHWEVAVSILGHAKRTSVATRLTKAFVAAKSKQIRNHADGVKAGQQVA
ncbi:MAG: reverse transcriptase domain-containing protein [Aeromonas sp.]